MADYAPPPPLIYTAFRLGFRVVSHLFFREIQTTGAHLVPTDDPCIFIVGPHANQFIDGVTLLSRNPRHSYVLMASVSYNRPLIGHVGKFLSAIPVVRPQDIVHLGTGRITYDPTNDPFHITGHNTRFSKELGARDFIIFGHNHKGHVARVTSDTSIEITHAIPNISTITEFDGFKIAPHVDQTPVYDEVHSYLNRNECITVFPEGGSHDRPEMLPLKAGFAVMALGAMAENPDLIQKLKIVPVGLNYFHPDRFRSRAVVSFGLPLTVHPTLVEQFKRGGKERRDAITQLLDESDEAFKTVTTNAPDYDTLMVIQAARRLYNTKKLTSLQQVVELNRNFVGGWTRLNKEDPRLLALTRKVKLYNDTLSFLGIRDHQVDKLNITPVRASLLLMRRLLKLFVLAGLGAPALISNLPLIWATNTISKRKQKEALAGSMVKIAGKDVLATWKIIVAGIAAPLLYGFYALLYFGYLIKGKPELTMKTKMMRACMAWAVQPILHYILMRLGDRGIDIYKSIKPLFLAVRNPEVGQILRVMRNDLSRDITSFVHEHQDIFFPKVKGKDDEQQDENRKPDLTKKKSFIHRGK
ncbi:hypothetical protein BDB00DRAFT_855268 [Zychaea mexicana]|uniref:uncharacterized protein n=1 Tax=Zychaea mexicana TaxID=64656 RepID=UPI0022FF2CE1|nr:uncharacterized protein BDB00DRAFT_855268 [Zychaea mexicana]KAI9484511.1 hypothetical protein BDB00DRAFT_855268 [Zychaea mexicana]